MSVHQIKAVVDGIHPPIWRRLQVRSGRPLTHLHDVLQAALGWEDYRVSRGHARWDRRAVGSMI